MQKHTDLTLIIHCSEKPADEKIKAYQAFCKQVIFICDDVNSPALTENFTTVRQQNGTAAALNTATQRANGAHILWLHADETIPELPQLHQNVYGVARISNESEQMPIQNWQIRLLPNSGPEKALFQGFEIPEIYSTAQQTGWQRSEQDLHIHCKKPLFSPEAIRKEAEAEDHSTMHSFWKGMIRTEEKKFPKAIACFKEVLKQRHLSFWNKLAALNSLANAYLETYKLQKARQTAKRSLGLTDKQRAPRLTLYQYYDLQANHEAAYEVLKKYQQTAQVSTKANWDVYLPKPQAIYLMAERSVYLGCHENAMKHYAQFYECNNGNVNDDILEKLLLYAIELGDRKKAVQYFKTLFGPDLTKDFEKKQIARVKEVLILFASRDWYKFINKVYEQLVAQNPNSERLRNGWIRMLVQNDEIKRAQALF